MNCFSYNGLYFLGNNNFSIGAKEHVIQHFGEEKQIREGSIAPSQYPLILYIFGDKFFCYLKCFTQVTPMLT